MAVLIRTPKQHRHSLHLIVITVGPARFHDAGLGMRVGSEENMSDLVSQHVGQKCRGQPRPARPRDQQTVVHYGNNRNTVKWLRVGQGSWMRAFGYAGCERGVNREGVSRWAADL